ncbi:MAG: sterol desaturase family protein [Myxococcales bacterium]|nr:sterol desaturase family protein [Myxococcales bacterium]MCB9648753.1 sterol desaturase family protein [Deltaproteobacteria bacterium]
MAGYELYVIITAVLLLSGVALWSLTAYHMSPSSQGLHISDAKRRPVETSRFSKQAIFNSALSFTLIYGTAYLLHDVAFTPAPAPLWRVLLEPVGILLFYDFMYYLLHRYPFHEWGVLKKVHAVHHTIKHPNALDSLWLHPVENFLGIALMWFAVFVWSRVFGPLSVYTFGVVFLAYSLINIVVHMGFHFEGTMRVFSYLGERHYKHHASMKAGNFANLFPFYDMVFGSEEA